MGKVSRVIRDQHPRFDPWWSAASNVLDKLEDPVAQAFVARAIDDRTHTATLTEATVGVIWRWAALHHLHGWSLGGETAVKADVLTVH